MLSPLRASTGRVHVDRGLMQPNYQDRLDYLYGRLNYEWSGMPRSSAQLRLGRMRRLLRRMGDPHLEYPIVHVAGTKGKGSTSAMIAAALTAAGIRTGLYCSPHLHRLEERFTIDGSPASAAELVALVDLARDAVEALEKESDPLGQRGLTFFEITTAMGLLHFARRTVRAVVLEVGLGGRLDSTNVVHPALSVITSISFDHMRQLGNTLAAIAGEKAGILKRGRPGLDRRARQRGARSHPPGGPQAGLALARARCRLLVRANSACAPLDPADHGSCGCAHLEDRLGPPGRAPSRRASSPQRSRRARGARPPGGGRARPSCEPR